MAESVYIGWLGPIRFESTASGIIFPGTVSAPRFFADASATLPGFSITGDTNTGFGASAADTAAIWAGGTTPRVTVTATEFTSTLPYRSAGGTDLRLQPGSSGDVSLQTADGSPRFRIIAATGNSQVADSNSFGWSDVSLSRGAANRLDLATGDSFNVVNGSYMAGGVAGVSFSGAVTNITVVNGIVTAAS